MKVIMILMVIYIGSEVDEAKIDSLIDKELEKEEIGNYN